MRWHPQGDLITSSLKITTQPQDPNESSIVKISPPPSCKSALYVTLPLWVPHTLTLNIQTFPSYTQRFKHHETIPTPTTTSCDPWWIQYQLLNLRTVFIISKDKVVGPDGFLIEFFQQYWDIIWEDLYRAVTTFYHNKLDLWKINQAYITLILKRTRVTTISDFWSIIVLSVVLKILTKILATRLQPYIPFLVDKHQTTFTRGRQLMQTFITTWNTASPVQKQNPFVFF
jgi:hypothetical protein